MRTLQLSLAYESGIIGYRQIQTQGFLTTALGRKRHFLGRRFDENTLREAIAFGATVNRGRTAQSLSLARMEV